MEYNVGAVLVAYVLLLTAFIAVLVAIYASIVKKRLNHQYEKAATKIIPENLNTFFGYNSFMHILFGSFKASSFNLPMIIILLVNFPSSTNTVRIML